ncbi:hypothetical protein SAMN02745116_00014 [Pilibacter termitis]|uniref:Uncharacterized protein n=1 Tax=Pilibacter termitis TaxID=263852 RepID=A0A1T4K0Y9_9ENTE|nr:hypothetical protein [Pilibacter termitis]SJZ36091.1 hypothetical protein SAMN02745116_00014 [Pilibacter termitis]
MSDVVHLLETKFRSTLRTVAQLQPLVARQKRGEKMNDFLRKFLCHIILTPIAFFLGFLETKEYIQNKRRLVLLLLFFLFYGKESLEIVFILVLIMVAFERFLTKIYREYKER